MSSDMRVSIASSCLSVPGAELQLGQDLGGNVLIFVISVFRMALLMSLTFILKKKNIIIIYIDMQ